MFSRIHFSARLKNEHRANITSWRKDAWPWRIRNEKERKSNNSNSESSINKRNSLFLNGRKNNNTKRNHFIHSLRLLTAVDVKRTSSSCIDRFSSDDWRLFVTRRISRLSCEIDHQWFRRTDLHVDNDHWSVSIIEHWKTMDVVWRSLFNLVSFCLYDCLLGFWSPAKILYVGLMTLCLIGLLVGSLCLILGRRRRRRSTSIEYRSVTNVW